MAQPHPWTLDDPFLYRVTAVVATAATGPHRQDVRCGFRDLRIVDGYFRLNGRRIFLQQHAHRQPHALGQHRAGAAPDLLRRDLLYAKAAGFNMVRFISGVAYP